MTQKRDLKVQEWFQEIDDGLEFRRRYGLENHWAELEALFYHVHGSQKHGVPNLLAGVGDALISTLTVPSPYFMVSATRPEQVLTSKVVEAIDNELFEELQLAQEVETAALHAFIFGKGILKFGFDSEFGYAPELDFGFGMTMSQFDSKGNKIEHSGVRPGMPWVKACLAHDVVVPYGTFRDEDAQWIAHRVVRHIDAIKADPKYINTKNLQPVMSQADFVRSYITSVKPYRVGHSFTQRSGDATQKAEFCEIWEIHDSRTGRLYAIATGHKKYLRNQIDALQIKGLPFLSFSFVPRTRTYWSTPDAYYLRYAQAELTDIAIQTSKHRRINIAKFLYNESMIDDVELEKLLSANVGAAIKIQAGASDLKNAVLPIQPSNLYQALYADAEAIRRDARETAGFSRNTMGEFEKGRKTATETLAVRESGGIRLSRRQKVMRDAYVKSMQKINQIIFRYWKSPRIAQIVGAGGAAQWVRYNGAQLRGDYKYKVSFSSKRELSVEERQQQGAAIYAALAEDPAVDPLQLRLYLIRAFNDPEFSSLFKQGLLNAPLRVPMQGGGGASANRGAATGGQAQPQASPVSSM